jgi:hypothetical protein
MSCFRKGSQEGSMALRMSEHGLLQAVHNFLQDSSEMGGIFDFRAFAPGRNGAPER